MKKSCLEKESKVVTSKQADEDLKDCKKEQLSQDLVYENEKGLNGGIDTEGLATNKKNNVLKTVNVTPNNSEKERISKISPRLAKTVALKPGRWVENSFDNTKKDEKSAKSKTANSSNKKSSFLTVLNKKNQEHQKDGVQLRKRKETAETDSNSPVSNKRVHYIKINVEGSSKDDNSAGGENCSSEEDSQESCGSRKRTSHSVNNSVDGAKKLKMEDSNNGMFLEEENSDRTELKVETLRQSVTFETREITTIISECDLRNEKWKETSSQYRCPTRWGIPIVKNYNEKWDGERIAPKLLQRYQKYLSSKNMSHSLFFPSKLQNNSDLSNFDNEICSQSSTLINSGCGGDLEGEIRDSNESFFDEGDPKKSGADNNLNVSNPEVRSRMVLRNRNQKHTFLDEENDYSSDESDDWLSNKQSKKKPKVNAKNKKVNNQNKQLVLELERCNLNKKNGSEDGRKNGNENFNRGLMHEPNLLNQSDYNLKSEPDPDTMVCPICSLRFKKQLIESHATECASKTYKD